MLAIDETRHTLIHLRHESGKFVETARHQVAKYPVTLAVHGEGKAATAENVIALEAYLRTLRPAPSLALARDEANPIAMARGRKVFEKQGCANCHQGATLTSADTYDVNLSDEAGLSEFNPPSLLGVSQRDHLFHDGRANDLRDVIGRFRHGLTSDLTEQESSDLLVYLYGI